jgi:hypothetical protein
MNIKKNTDIVITLGLVLMMVSFSPSARAQQTGEPQADEPLTLEDFYLTAGKLLATGADKEASGPLRIKSYKVEEVKLPRPLKLGGSTEAKTIESLLRLTVTVDSSPPNGGYVILVDDEPQTAVVTERNGFRPYTPTLDSWRTARKSQWRPEQVVKDVSYRR